MELETSNQKIAGVLSHVEAVYRPGDRQLAIDLFEALGCKTFDTGTKSPAGTTYISVHPDPEDRSHDNALYLSEMPAEQLGLENVLRQRIDSDAELSAACSTYQGMADKQPFGLSHVALRYPTFEVMEKVLAGFEQRLTPELRSRIVFKVFRPGDCEELGSDSIQAFVYTDIAVAGISMFGQVFELAAYE